MSLPSGYRPAPGLLRERVILVAGGSRGLGLACAEAFATLGARVVITGRDPDRLERACAAIAAAGGAEPAAIGIDFDTATRRDYDGVAGAVERAFGRLDGLLHSAVHLEKLAPVQDLDSDAWNRLLRVNFLAPLALANACLHLLARAPDASVAYVVDEHALSPGAWWGGVAAPRAALLAAMQAQAQEWESRPSLRLNALAPGAIGSPARASTHPGQHPDSLPAPQVVVPACCWLMGPDSRGTTGQVIRAQGPRREP
jgi:NAD(P)-dependent dehydrogenase (short-subunit alcohol dehydrogenase family)